jgi:uncharacterized damage-inducible protein DinB
VTERVDPDQLADEKTSLEQFLDFQRATVLIKAEGLSKEQLNRQLPPSELTLAKLLKHLALVEDSWFTERFAGRPEVEPWASAPFDDDPDWEFHTAHEDEPDSLRTLYEAAAARSRDITASAALTDLSAERFADGSRYSLRWLLLHMIEETARHAGHADLLREAVDGVTGE